MRWIRFIHTLLYLKPVQIWSRIFFHVKKTVFGFIIIDLVKRQKAVPELPTFNLIPKPHAPYAEKQNLERKQFVFLNQFANYDTDIRWNDPGKSKLWRYNLHYFDYLLPLLQEQSAKNYDRGRRIIEDWIKNNPIGHGDGWEPYPISVRVCNWIHFYAAFQNYIGKDPSFKEILLVSLFRQIAYLNYFFEWHLQANHFWVNAKALLFSGIFFGHKYWIEKGVKIVQQQLDEQVLNDGGHYERSPMYHALFLLDVIDLLNGIRASKIKIENLSRLNNILHHKALSMWKWLNHLTHPDGEIALLGDSVFNLAPQPGKIGEYLRAVLPTTIENTGKNEIAALKESGYFVVRENELYLVIDGGPLGVIYQPGHAHCDFLSYELSYKSRRFIVDSGIGEYLPTELRLKARSIYSHNTLVINQMEQAEIWHAFRMGKRIIPQNVQFASSPFIKFEGAYENFMNKESGYYHKRSILFQNTKEINIQDYFSPAEYRQAEDLIHLHPQCRAKIQNGAVIVERDNAVLNILFNSEEIQAELRPWFYAPEFGIIQQNQMIVLQPAHKNINKIEYTIKWT
ncbi:MAG TPA: alginate lyase family protein [Caldithrix abyssi]|uniref:Alginate lyase family protein n=1 Tax=Caldithrix abyssi TaxID=187145 RepID=A0A7V4WVZ8_CALAY|nr:alginate lyase family protein [Caldithrix abyssi]